MTIEERVTYACVHTGEDWLLEVICVLTQEGKITKQELANLAESLLEDV